MHLVSLEPKSLRLSLDDSIEVATRALLALQQPDGH